MEAEESPGGPPAKSCRRRPGRSASFGRAWGESAAGVERFYAADAGVTVSGSDAQLSP